MVDNIQVAINGHLRIELEREAVITVPLHVEVQLTDWCGEPDARRALELAIAHAAYDGSKKALILIKHYVPKEEPDVRPESQS